MSKGPYHSCKCGGYDGIRSYSTVLGGYADSPLRDSKDGLRVYHGEYEDTCATCHTAIQRANDYEYDRWDGMWDITQEVGLSIYGG